MITQPEAEALRDIGMALSEQKANRDSDGWTERAMLCVARWCHANWDDPDRKFLIEEVRDWGEHWGFIDAPENARAWGAVARRCAKEGIIRKAGYLPARSSNLSPKVAWMAV
jgi:hypothetical protein